MLPFRRSECRASHNSRVLPKSVEIRILHLASTFGFGMWLSVLVTIECQPGHEVPQTIVIIPRGSIYTTIMELGPKKPSPLWFWGPNSIIVVYMDPL